MKNSVIFIFLKIYFTDECSLHALTEGTQFVRRRPGEELEPSCIQSRLKHPPSVMIWAAISAEGPGPLYFVEGMMRQDQYIRVLEDVFLPYVQQLRKSTDPFVFMQDNAPCHSAKSVKNFLSIKQISFLPWPGNSPDLNPIENVWKTLKSLVYLRHNPTLKVLKENILEVWQSAPEIKNCISSCIGSMPRRIEAVIKARGGCTKY